MCSDAQAWPLLSNKVALAESLLSAIVRADGDALVMHVGEYYSALGTKLPSPTFLTNVPIRFGIANANDRYHIAVLFGPWSYAYYRGS